MPHATPSALLYGDGSDPTTDTQTGELEIDPTTGDIMLSVVSGFSGGNLSFLAAERPVLKSRLQAAIDEFDAFQAGGGSGARTWDVTDDPADTDPKRIQLQENAATISIYSGLVQTIKVDTARGLLLAL